MKIAVVNGSPRGKYSITLQTLLYLEKRFPGHSFSFSSVMDKKREKAFLAIDDADIVIFSFPIYTFLCPSQLHAFISDMKKEGERWKGKWASLVCTSKHFYDITGMEYMYQNLLDMGFKVIGGFSADMEDLPTPQGQREADDFFLRLLFSYENGISIEHRVRPPIHQEPYVPLGIKTEKDSSKKVTIVADFSGDDGTLRAMTDDFSSAFPYSTSLVDISSFPFKGGCIGCFSCTGDGKCIWNDGFETLLRDTILKSDAIVMAFTIKDHSMGPVFKTYDDRQFCNGHRTLSKGVPFAYIMRGDIDSEENLKTVIRARADVGRNPLSPLAHDRASMEKMIKILRHDMEHPSLPPRTFFSVGGMKIFRDLVWSMRGLMKEDHIFYKNTGLYDDFPQKHRGKMVSMCLIGSVMRNKKLRRKAGEKINQGMVAPYRKAIDEATEYK
ncbi:MAG: flavodoxin family protein [Candidatus Ornithospirochaeta sp.]